MGRLASGLVESYQTGIALGRLSSEFAEVFAVGPPQGLVAAAFIEVFAEDFAPYGRLASGLAEVFQQGDPTGRLASEFLEVFAEDFVTEVVLPPCLPGAPSERFVLSDPKFRGASSLVSATSQRGPYPGSVSAVSTNKGLMFPVLSGVLNDSAEPLRFGLMQAGGPGVGEFGWRRASDAADQFRGTDDIRRFWGHHAPITGTLASDNCAAAFAPQFRRLLVMKVDDTASPSLVQINYRDIDLDRYDDWTPASFNLVNDIASGHHNVQVINLPDGRLCMLARTGNDFDVYHSDDGGQNWDLVSDSIVATYKVPGVAFPSHLLNSQFRVKQSGEFIRLLLMTSGTPAAYTFLSTDRGISWQQMTNGFGSGTVPFNNGATDDPIPFDMLPVDDSGTFVVAFATSNTGFTHQYAVGDGDWQFQTLGVSVAVGNIKQIAMVKTPQYLTQYVFWSDGTAGSADGYTFRRCRPERFQDFNNLSGVGWENLDQMQPFESGIKFAPGRLNAVWAGDRTFLFGSRRSSVGNLFDDINLPLGWYHGGWTRRSLWRARPSRALADLTNSLYGRFWTVECDKPSAPAGSPWTELGTGVTDASMQDMRIESTAGNGRAYLESIPAIGGPAWGHEFDACFGWTVRLDTGDGSASTDEVAVRIVGRDRATAGGKRVDVSLRHSPNGIRIRDNNIAVNLEDVPIPLDTGSAGKYFEVRFVLIGPGFGPSTRCQLSWLDHDTGIWTSGAVHLVNTATVAPGTNDVTFGNLSAPGAGTTISWWRDFWVSELGAANQVSHSNPGSQVGFPLTAGEPVLIEHGLEVQWGGLGGALGDQFNADVAYAHPASNLAVDSPRLEWRSLDDSANTLIFDADPTGGNNRWVHDAIGIFGCNNRTVLVDYDTDPLFGSPTTAVTVDFTAFETGTTPLVALVPAGNTLTVVGVATTQFVKGQLVGFYVEVTSGPAVGRVWKITKHDRRDQLYFEDEATTPAAQGLVPGNTLVVFSPNAVKSYPAEVNERYMRVRFGAVDTAEGHHRCGTVIPGTSHSIQVPLDWARTNNEQPNVTQYRTRSAVQWYFEEGPPQRTWTGRMVGDVTQLQREKLRGLIRSNGYEVRPIAWVFDDERPVDSCALVRWVGGSQMDNAGYFRDENDVIRAVGDQTITLVEEV